MKRLLTLTAATLAVFAMTACDTDRGARKDLPVEQQQLDETDARVYLMPDAFPNIVHKCDGTTGLWTTTDRNVWIVYQDILCDGDGTGQVFDNIPGGAQQAVTE